MKVLVEIFCKSDLPGADRLRDQIVEAQMLIDSPRAPVCSVSSLQEEGMAQLLEHITTISEVKQNHTVQTEIWTHRLRLRLRDDLFIGLPADLLANHAQRVSEKIEDPHSAIMALKAAWLASDKNAH